MRLAVLPDGIKTVDVILALLPAYHIDAALYDNG